MAGIGPQVFYVCTAPDIQGGFLAFDGGDQSREERCEV